MIKNRLVLSYLTDEMWQKAKKTAVMQWIDSNTYILIAYIDKTKKKLRLIEEVPKRDDADRIAYFLRDTNGPQLTPDNFMQLVQFGSMSNLNLVQSLKQNLSGICVPMMAKNNTWSDGIRNEYLAELHKFMSVLTDTLWRMQSKTILYIPPGSADLTPALASDKELVRRLQSE